MNCEIIAVGTELLTGDTVNTNAAYLSKELSLAGFSVLYQTTVGDNPGRLQEVVKHALERSDIIITTGGLGPTQDDLTKETIADIFGMKLIKNPLVVKALEDFFASRDYPITENNFRQAYIPEGATMIENPRGTAPGIIIEKNGKTIIMLPGPPREMKGMFQEKIFPYINKLENQIVLSRYYNVSEMGESAVEDRIMDIVDNQTNPTIATYASIGEVIIRLTANGKDEQQINALLDKYEIIIREKFKGHIFTESRDHIQDVVGKLLIDRHKSIAVAESCTGGLLSKSLTDVPGISAVFTMGLVTYANEAKENLLHVNHETLETYGAVSEETAREMCEHLLTISGCDVAVSTTGVAGPDGGTMEKPVGLVYIGVATKEGTEITKNLFGGNRDIIRKRAVNKAFSMIRRAVLDKD